MQIYRAEGIILKSFNFQEHDKILTVFTQDLGIIKFIVKKTNFKRFGGHMTVPLTHAEFMYTQGKSELLKCQEISLINAHLSLRDSIDRLESACEILQAIGDSQLPNTPAPDIFLLCSRYLKKISVVSDPYLLVNSFRLKILRHDGLLGLSPTCSVCGIVLSNQCISSGQSFCSAHAPRQAIHFDSDETDALLLLAFCQSFTQLDGWPLTVSLRDKIKQLFLEQTSSQSF